MAKKDSSDFTPQDSSSVGSKTFDKSLEKDVNSIHIEKNEWSYARNAINNSNIGDVGRIGNEPANKFCIKVEHKVGNNVYPLTIIGFIHLENDMWAVFSTDNSYSEIGFFKENTCEYYRIVNDNCLKFNINNLIYGQSRELFDCTWGLYWADGLNPDRYMNIGDIRYAPYADPWPGVPYVCIDANPVPACSLGSNVPATPCFVCTPVLPLALRCDEIRLETFMVPICLTVSKGEDGGELLNGSYFVTAAYTVNGQRVTDYCTPSNVQPLFQPDGVGGSLKIKVCAIDTVNFDEFELVIVSVISQQTVAKRLGTYTTRQAEVTIDIIDVSLPSIPIEQIPALNVVYEKSDAIYKVNDYLIRVAPTSKFQFNYQPLANQIRTKWVSVEYPEDYYKKGGNNTGYMRDEVYSFFIRWIYKTGDKSASFHIPGRPYIDDPAWDRRTVGANDADVIELAQGFNLNSIQSWMVYNTAPSAAPYLTVRNTAQNCPYVLCDGGIVISEGYMGYWESTEKYPDNKPDIWNTSSHTWSCLNPPGTCQPNLPYPLSARVDYDLCGKPIRHHKFPDNDLHPSVSHFRSIGCSSTAPSWPPAQSACTNPATPLSDPNKNHIRIMGVQFENIRPPVDNNGVLIPNIVGYEILRGSRVGNKSVIAKGIINNMGQFDLNVKGNSNLVGLYQNYPYNDLQRNPYLSSTKTRTQSFTVSTPGDYNPYTIFKQDVFSFHSPEMNFTNPYLSSTELKIYQDLCGTVFMKHKYVDRHPKTILLKDIAMVLSLVAGIAAAAYATSGGRTSTKGSKVNISNIAGTKYKYTDRVNYSLSAQVYGSVGNLNQTNSFDNTQQHPLANQAATQARGYNTASKAFIEGVQLGVGGGRAGYNLIAVALGGFGYADKNNPITNNLESTLFNNAYSVNKKTGFGFTPYEVFEWGKADYTPKVLYLAPNALSLLGGGSGLSNGTFLYYLTEGAELAWRAMYAFSSPQHHELQTVSNCFYGAYGPRPLTQRRRIITEQTYIDNQIHPFAKDYRINNLNRGRYVALQISGVFQAPFNNPNYDNSRFGTRLIDAPVGTAVPNNELYRNPEMSFQRNSSTYYAAIKQRIRNQYGQLSNIKQIPISCNINYCYNTGANRVLSLQEGYNLRGGFSSLAFNCPNNILVDGDFPNPGSVGPTPAPWQSYPLNYWRQTTVGGQTVARNDGGGLWLAPPYPKLYQVFPGGTAIAPGSVINNFSYDIIEMPLGSMDYILNVWLGDVGSPVLLDSIDGASIPSLPLTRNITGLSNTASVAYNRITFELELADPADFEKADVIGFPQLGEPYVDDDPSQPTYKGRCAYSWFTFAFTNQQGSNVNGGNIIVSDTRLDLAFPAPGGGTYPSIWDSNVQNGKLENYITNIKCPTRIYWNFRIQTKWFPCFCGSSGVSYACQNLWGGPWWAPANYPGPGGNPGPFYDPALFILSPVFGLLMVHPGTFPGSINNCGQVGEAFYGNGGTYGPGQVPPALYGFLPACYSIGQITIGLYKLTQAVGNSAPVPTGNSRGLLIQQIYQDLNINNLTYGAQIPIIGNILIDGGPNNPGGYDPTARYYFLIETANGVNFVMNSGDIRTEACETQESVSITNVCLDANTFVGIPGCTDNAAVNYQPQANVDNGSCMYCACLTPGQVNTQQQVVCPTCPQGVMYLNCDTDPACDPCCQPIPDPGVGTVVPTLGTTYGTCNWPCVNANTGGSNSPSCVITVTNKTYPLFGGDVYIGRYTEKNSFFYFNNWLYGQPDRAEFDYYKYRMIPYPAYWYNSEGISLTECVDSFLNFLSNPFNWNASGFSSLVYPSKYHCLDRPNAQAGLAIKYGYIYLFNSGVRDFFVESEYNVDLRDYGNDVSERHYSAIGPNAYTDIEAMFEPNVITAGNFYKYDNSLSIAKIWYSYVNFGSVYPPYYDPEVAETCYQYRPERLLYSLQGNRERIRDNWRIFLTNNYKDFVSNINCVKQINKNGILILFDSASPLMYQGVDTLQTDLSTKITLGDGGLFSQAEQNLVNADRPFEYASCQNKLSVINTPVGTFWISQNQGKIYHLSNSLTEISMTNIKWWLAQYLPYKLTSVFPDYVVNDNPVAGIGCQTVYDNTNGLVYFTKKDYMPLKVVVNGVNVYKVNYNASTNTFTTNPLAINGPAVTVNLGDPLYFEDASWTISYDVKIKSWISFHDWHPGLVASGKNTFMTTKDNGVWIHNQRCDLYANYYGVSYPFEIEYMVNTIQTVNILRSIEYQLESYKYKFDNCYDRFHMLDYNFDEAVVYNTEQCSGLLKLDLTPKNNAPSIVQYPIVNPTNIKILYSKEENRYRFNQFWDITRDRGEFDFVTNDYNNTTLNALNTAISAIPGNLNDTPNSTAAYPGGTPLVPGNYAQQTIWNTESNGYKRTLNASNLNYSKLQLQHKKFRHYTTSVLLRRKAGLYNDVKMLVSIANNKMYYSPR